MSVEHLQTVVGNSTTVTVRGGGTKSEPAAAPLDMREHAGVTDYAPEECVFTARAGTPLREIDAMLQQHRQYLPFDPPYGADGATIGGTVAAGMSGPRRYRYGGVRDFLIGVRLIDGEGRLIRSGGNVVKNAAGFLLHHGIVGSRGQFGVITEVTFKVFPAPEARECVSVPCRSVDAAFALARRLEDARLDCEAIDFDDRGELRVTVAGRARTMEARLAKVITALGPGAGSAASQSAPAATSPSDSASVVKVPGVMKAWGQLRDHVRAAHFMCAGAVAWLVTTDVDGLGSTLQAAGLQGQVIRGNHAGRRVGRSAVNVFEERVRRVLDPYNRFSAASNPRG